VGESWDEGSVVHLSKSPSSAFGTFFRKREKEKHALTIPDGRDTLRR
jgi:hypothetical protein